MTSSRLAPPVAFGLPPKFSAWRKGQYGMATLPIDSMKRFIGMAAPTGSGKSAAYVTSSLLSGGRVAVLTSTKGLQSQLVSDFGTIGMSDIRGQNAYLCVAASSFGDPDYTTCNDGACHSGAGCSLRDSGCLYYDAYREALNSSLMVTNYSYWFHIHEYGQGLGKFDMLICDECFSAGTLVDGVPIEKRKVGDYIRTFDEIKQRWNYGRISKVFKRQAERVCRLHFADGNSICCTLNHPFYTRQGWQPAYKLLLGNVQCLSHRRSYERPKRFPFRQEENALPTIYKDFVPLVREGNLHSWFQELRGLSQSQARVLLSRVRPSLYRTGEEPEEIGAVGEADALPQAESAQSYAEQVSSRQGQYLAACDGMETCGARGQRTRTYPAAETIGRDVGMDRFRTPYLSGSEEEIFTDLLQGGYSSLCFQNRYRDRWPLAQCIESAEIGSETGSDTHWTWVDGFEVYQPADREGFASVCPDGHVYNLEVERDHNYIADGMVVHNCHDAPNELSSFMAVELDRKLVKRILHLDVPKADSKQSHWQDWGMSGEKTVERMEMELEKAMKIQLLPTRNLRHELKEIKKLKQKLTTLACMKGEWVSEGSEDGERVTIAPVECKGYAERFLFRDIPKVVLVSATMRPKTAELLGIDSEQLEFAEYSSTFPIRNRPVYIVPGARMNHKMDESNLRWWLSRIDNIIDKRLDRKGIIHTVSYKRAKYILTHSRHRHIMMTHHTRDIREAIQEFKDSSSPRILVSPSIVTGYDFPFAAAEYGIIAKVPFPDTRGEVMKARSKADKDYAYYIAVQTMVQAAGRIVRAEEDRGESFIVDDTVNAVWFRPKMKLFSPRWFQEAVTNLNVVPAPPPPLELEGYRQIIERCIEAEADSGPRKE